MILLKSWGFILLFLVTGTGCTLDEYLYGVVVENQSGVLKKAVKGVEFSFCLLNENGQPASVFKEGENFSFQFKIKNNTTATLPFYDFGFYNTYDFLNIRKGDTYLGKPMKFLKYITPGETGQIVPDGTQEFSLPWHEERNEFQLMNGYFEGLKQPRLSKGKYYTKFTYNFRFGYRDQTPVIETGKMTFIINFEIK